jgi:hypothetical protein
MRGALDAGPTSVRSRFETNAGQKCPLRYRLVIPPDLTQLDFTGPLTVWTSQISLLAQPLDQHPLNKRGRRQLLGSCRVLDGLFHVFSNPQKNRFGFVHDTVTLSTWETSALIKVVQRLF